MKNENIKLLEGAIIETISVQSFYLDHKLIAPINQLYLKTNKGNWFSLSVEDGANHLSGIQAQPQIVTLDIENSKFSYPVVTLSSDYTGKKITGIREYLCSGKDSDIYCGFFIALEQHPGFSLYETNNELLILKTGIIHEAGSFLR